MNGRGASGKRWSGGAIEAQRRETFKVVLASLAVVTAFLAVGALARPTPRLDSIVAFYVPLFTVYGLSALLYRSGRTRAASLLATGTIFVMVTGAVNFFGGISGQVASAYFIVVLAAALTLGAVAAIAFTVAIVAAMAWLAHLETTGQLPPPYHPLSTYDHFISITGTVALSAYLLRCALQVIEGALTRAERDERASLESLRALEEATTALEVRARRERAIRDLAESLLMTSDPAVMAQLAGLAVSGAFERGESSLLLHVRAERTLRNVTPANTVDLASSSIAALLASVREHQVARPVTLEDAHGRSRPALAVSLLGRANAYGVLVVYLEPEESSLADDLSGYVTTLGSVLGSAFDRIHVERQLRESQRLESLGRLAGGVAHDFNNLLTVILGASAALQRSVGEKERALVDEITQTSRRASELTRQLLTFGSREGVEVAPLDLDEVIQSLSAILSRALGPEVSLELDLASEGKRIVADRTGLEQVLMNLAVNGRDAMPNGGKLRIATRASNMPDPELPGVDRSVVLTIEDDGVGMTPEVSARLFEPFFSTKEPGQGTGLGLPTVYGIVTGLGGRVEVDSAPGEGTRFRCVFPEGDQASRVTLRQRTSSVAPPGPIPLDDESSGGERSA